MEQKVLPVKNLKQATLSFFKENQEKSVLKAASAPCQGKKRRISNSSESPNKSAKLSKPLKVLISSDAPNVKSTKPEASSKEDDVQEVSSSSEAENPVTVKSNSGRCCLIDRFVKKVTHDGQHEISSTNNELDTSQEKNNKASSDDKSKSFLSLDDSILVVSDDEKDTSDASAFANAVCSVKENTESLENSSKDVSEDDSDKDNISFDQSIKSDHKVDTDEERDALHREVLLKSPKVRLSKLLTSTPLKIESSSEGKLKDSPVCSLQASPMTTPSTSSGKKKGRKVDPVKKAEQEALREKLKQEKESQRLERKRKLEEAKLEKDKIKKERQEIIDKERLEKDKAKEEEKKKKEEERLQREEEKQKKLAALEVKQEEKRKKEDEKKRKDDEKMKEEELKTKKAEKVKSAFKNFFVKQTDGTCKLTPSKSQRLFIPFELKKDMHLAPTMRRDPMSEQDKTHLHSLMHCNKVNTDEKNYLMELQTETVKPHRTGRILRKNPQPEDEMDLEIIHDSEALKKVFHKVKLLHFHTDHRPPYYGTWRKQTPKLSPRNPFKKDEDMFDYEVDSDDEWEEEEPGESLSASDGEDDKDDKGDENGDENEEEEDGWMVPHGYLSENEGCNEDDEVTPEKLKLLQQAKAKAWDEDQKRKLHASPMIVIGCFFEHSPSEAMAGDIRLLYAYQAVVLVPDTPIPTCLAGELDTAEKGDESIADVTPTPKGPRRQAVPDEAMPDLIRLIHGNLCGIKKLVREFRVFWFRKCNSTTSESNILDDSDPDISIREKQLNSSELNDSICDVSDTTKFADKSCDNSLLEISDKCKEEGNGCEISKRQLEKKIMAMAVRERRAVCKKIAWYVHEPVLTEFKLSDIELPNAWEYLTSVPTKSPAVCSQPSLSSKPSAEATKTEEVPDTITPTPRDQRSIMDFTLSKKELENVAQSTRENSVINVKTKENNLISSEAGVSQVKKGNNQRSIIDFALSKKVIGNTSDSSSKMTSNNSSVMAQEEKVKEVVNSQDRKVNNQRSIMDFAKTVDNSQTVARKVAIENSMEIIMIDDESLDKT